MYFRPERAVAKFCAMCFRPCGICGAHVPKGGPIAQLRDAVGYFVPAYICDRHTDENDLVEFGKNQLAPIKDNDCHRTDEDILLEMYERDRQRRS